MYFAYFYCCGDKDTLSAAWAAAREAGGKIGNYSFLGEYPKPTGSKYGMPGIVIWGHLFIGLRRDSDQYRIYLGSWPSQDSYTNDFKVDRGFPCQPFVEIELMNEYRVELEESFFDSIESCISLITASGNKSSFPNWKFTDA